MDCPVFSFGIVSYKNYKYIKEAVDSLLRQDYPRIELIIANDASDDFQERELADYIETHKRENIVRVIIQNQEKNVGTVRNIEWVRQKSSGEYIMYMAADDALYDGTVLSRYVREFQKNEDILVLSSKTAMCGTELNDIMEYIPDEEGIHVIKDLSPAEMFSFETHTFLVPTTSTCYRRRLYDVIGPYDTDYFIIEDASLYLRMARMGIGVHWIDDMVGARHRDGGISHGNTTNLTLPYQNYRFDEIVLYSKEVLPYQEMILDKDRKKMEEKWQYIQYAYYETFVRPNCSETATFAEQMIDFADFAWEKGKNLFKNVVHMTIKPKMFRKTYMAMCILWILAVLCELTNIHRFSCLAKVILGLPIGVCAIFLLIMSAMGMWLVLAKLSQKIVRLFETKEKRTIYVIRPGCDEENRDVIKYEINLQPHVSNMRPWINAVLKISCKIGLLFVIDLIIIYFLYGR